MTSTLRGDTTCAKALVRNASAHSVTASAATTRGRILASISKRQSHGQLNLTRRTRFARGQARPRDLTECWAADDVARRAEVGMVEHIEHIDPELQTETRAGLRVLDQRQIRVVEARSNDDVATQVAEMIGGHQHRWIEPPVDRADDPDGAGDVGTYAVGRAIETAVTGHEVHRIAAL